MVRTGKRLSKCVDMLRGLAPEPDGALLAQKAGLVPRLRGGVELTSLAPWPRITDELAKPISGEVPKINTTITAMNPKIHIKRLMPAPRDMNGISRQAKLPPPETSGQGWTPDIAAQPWTAS